ncbi:MAG: hypothetical protein FJ110_04585 [Deltaproteobacteria bacterium]|nr:hypothetical protein [Deltaproteobacteria bacterium]
MEIIKKAQSGPHKFKVVKSFSWGGSVKAAGEEIEISNAQEAFGLVQVGRVIPADLPATAEYIALRDIKLSGKVKAFEAKRMEKVILKAEQALALLLEGAILPCDEDQWRPNNRKLLKGRDRTEEEQAARAEAAFQGKLMEMGLGPYKSRK